MDATPSPNGHIVHPEIPPPRRVHRALLAGFLVLVALAWAFALWYSISHRNEGALTREVRGELAESCAAARDELRSLPALGRDSTALDAVALTRREDEVFTRLIADIRSIGARVEGDDERRAVSLWADDWDAVVAARASYADELEATGTGRFEIPLEIVLRIETYAVAQGLRSCSPEALQLDVVDAPRGYVEVE